MPTDHPAAHAGGEAQGKGLPEEWDRVRWSTQHMSQRPHGGLRTQQGDGQGEGNEHFLSTCSVELLCAQK